MWRFTKEDYIHTLKKSGGLKKPKKEKQAQLPKPDPCYNGSKSIPGEHKVKFQRAKDLK